MSSARRVDGSYAGASKRLVLSSRDASDAHVAGAGTLNGSLFLRHR